MLSQTEQEKIADIFYKNYREVEIKYLGLISNQLNDIGTLNASNLKRLEQLAIMNGNITEINKLLAQATNKSLKELETQLMELAQEQYNDSLKYYKASGIKQINFADNLAIQKLILSVNKITGGTMRNISKSTVVAKQYRKAIDEGILAVTSGVDSYSSVMAKTYRELAREGIQTQSVKYASGNRRRLDTAIRMNVLDGMHSVNLGVAQQTGKEFGADGVEISSHSNPAPDHKNIDGATMTKKQYDTFQKTAKRPIGELGCYHFAIPIILDIHIPNMTEKERAEKRKNEDKKINGKTKYEWSQVQRQLETKIRYQNDIMKLAPKGSNLYEEAKNKNKIYLAEYKNISKNAGLDLELERAK